MCANDINAIGANDPDTQVSANGTNANDSNDAIDAKKTIDANDKHTHACANYLGLAANDAIYETNAIDANDAIDAEHVRDAHDSIDAMNTIDASMAIYPMNAYDAMNVIDANMNAGVRVCAETLENVNEFESVYDLLNDMNEMHEVNKNINECC